MNTTSREILEKSPSPTVQARATLNTTTDQNAHLAGFLLWAMPNHAQELWSFCLAVMELETAADHLAASPDLQHLKAPLSDRIEKSGFKQTARLTAPEIRPVLWMFGILGGFAILIHRFLAHAR